MKISHRICLVLSAGIYVTAFAPTNNVERQGLTQLRNSLVVISPPGGVGEVAAVEAASMGSAVRWFVVSDAESSDSSQVVLSATALQEIEQAGGSVELAGANAGSLLLGDEDASSSIPAVSAWCGAANALVCTYDGIQGGKSPQGTWKDAIKVAAREAATKISGGKVAILSAADEEEGIDSDDEPDEGSGIGGLVGNLFGGGSSVPPSLAQAMAGDARKVTIVRYGQLFGMPESSPEFSALVGGPRRTPELCEEWQNREVRVDPTLVAGNVMVNEASRSSRQSLGQAASLLALGKIPAKAGLDVCIASNRGTEKATMEMWQSEFDRAEEALKDTGVGTKLFTADFANVPDQPRLAEWLATKWAPAVLRTYDIAAIRTGARPVYANKVDDTSVEIVWQELVDFATKTVGKMRIEVSENGILAQRVAATPQGAIPRKPLNGEDVLVRRLSEAASQAVEKGLAKKAKAAKPPKPAQAPAPKIATTIVSSGVVEQPESASSGPRSTGARRSKQRERGQRKK